jgi:small subunit ribosomal protein S21
MLHLSFILLVTGRLNFSKKEVKAVVKVKLRENESQEQLLRRFRKSVVKSSVLTDVRRKRWHVSKSELRRIAKKKAERRMRRRRYQR